jgi:hypothetical protein
MRRLLLLAGLAVGGLVWAINTQLGEILPYPECRTHIALLALTSLAVGLMATSAALLSWRSGRPGDGAADVFLSGLGIMAGLLFAFAIALQGAASLVLTGCER